MASPILIVADPPAIPGFRENFSDPRKREGMGGGQKGKREREADWVSRWEGGDAAQRSRAVPFPLEKAEKIVVIWVERKEGEECCAANDGGFTRL